MEKKVDPITKVQNLVVARYRDGRIVKGATYDFGPQKKGFYVIPLGEEGGKASEVLFVLSKAIKEVDTRKQDRLGFPDLLPEQG
ncbi:MAG: hypothetical protein ACUVWO_15785 [Thermodesulfobacteriota bacterium]